MSLQICLWAVVSEKKRENFQATIPTIYVIYRGILRSMPDVFCVGQIVRFILYLYFVKMKISVTAAASYKCMVLSHIVH